MHAESKGLTSRAFFPLGERGPPFSVLAGRLKRGETDLLILNGLLARLMGSVGERLLNIKDLLTVLPPRSSGELFGLCRKSEAW